MGSSHAAGSALENEIKNINLRLSFLAGDIRKNLASINSITEILNSHSHIDDENDVNNTNNENESKLDEISNILLDIGNAMSLDFANRIAENKEDIGDLKKQKSKGKFGRAESGVEKQKKERVAGNIFTKTADKASSPFSNIFGKLIALGGILGTGILANAVFEWFKDEENQKKVSKFFKILAKNWKWIVGTIGVLVGAKFLGSLLGAVVSLGLILKATSPLLLLLAGSDQGIKIMEDVAKRVFNKEIDLKQGVGPNDSKPFDISTMKVDGMRIDKYLESQPGGANEANILALIARLERDKPGWNRWNWMNPWNWDETGGPAAKTNRAILYLKQLLKKTRSSGNLSKVEQNNISKINNDLNNNNLNLASTKSGLNFIPINLPTITKNQPPSLSGSSVATNVLHISSKNVSDPYRQLTPDIYGIYV